MLGEKNRKIPGILLAKELTRANLKNTPSGIHAVIITYRQQMYDIHRMADTEMLMEIETPWKQIYFLCSKTNKQKMNLIPR